VHTLRRGGQRRDNVRRCVLGDGRKDQKSLKHVDFFRARLIATFSSCISEIELRHVN
jgi:hypothetical protein